MEIVASKVILLQRLHRLTEEIALGQNTKIIRRSLPEFAQLLGVALAEIDVPEHLQNIAAQQAHFIVLIEILGVRPLRIKPAIEAEQVGVILIGRAKTMNDQLRESEGFVRLFQQMFPTGKGQRVALRGFEAVEIHPVGIKAGQTFGHQQFAGDLTCGFKQTRAGLHDGRGEGFEGGFVCCVGQQTAFGSGHGFFILEKTRSEHDRLAQAKCVTRLWPGALLAAGEGWRMYHRRATSEK
nr:hypothetical protein [Pseudomonas sp.]